LFTGLEQLSERHEMILGERTGVTGRCKVFSSYAVQYDSTEFAVGENAVLRLIDCGRVLFVFVWYGFRIFTKFFFLFFEKTW
jgi:hypothetical protein